LPNAASPLITHVGAPTTILNKPVFSGETIRHTRINRVRLERETRSIVRHLQVNRVPTDRSSEQTTLLARDIVQRVRRVEKLPAPVQHRAASSPAETAFTQFNASTAPLVVKRATPAVPVVRIEPEPPRAPERPPAPMLNMEAIADSVLRQIDRRLVGQRERSGRF
jgi:hypothetical protein